MDYETTRRNLMKTLIAAGAALNNATAVADDARERDAAMRRPTHPETRTALRAERRARMEHDTAEVAYMDFVSSSSASL